MLIGNNDEEKIWNYLYSEFNNNYSTASLMGYLQTKSALNSINLQESFRKKLKYTNEMYTELVDNKSYKKFFYDKAGYGLIQVNSWDQKQRLFNFAQNIKVSIGDLEMQLNFLIKELVEFHPEAFIQFKNINNILDGLDIIIDDFKILKKGDKNNKQTILNYSQIFYNRYSNNNEKEIKNFNNKVRIGYIVVDEKSQIIGGKTESQSKNSICIRAFYNKPWLKIIRPLTEEIANKIAETMEQAYKNTYIEYNPSKRTELYDKAKKNNWDLSKIKNQCGTDCSALIAVCVNSAGLYVPKNIQIANEEEALINTKEFKVYTHKEMLTSSEYLKRGDILLGSSHTAIVLDNGSQKNTNSNFTFKNNSIGTIIVNKTTNIYNGPSEKYKIISNLKPNNKVEVLSILSNKWYKINCPSSDCGYGFINNSFVSYIGIIPKKLESIIVNYPIEIIEDTNIKNGPGDNYNTIKLAKKQTFYTIIKEAGEYGQLSSGGWIKLTSTRRRP